MEETKINVYKKLSQARVTLQQSKLKKSGKNKFSNFNYFELQDFLPTVNDIFNNLGLVAIFNLEEKRAKLKIVDTETLEDILFYTKIAEVNMKGSQAIQNLGAEHTYLKRYLYMNALEIAENDIVDASDKVTQNTTQQTQHSANQQLLQQVQERYRGILSLKNKDKTQQLVTLCGNFEILTTNKKGIDNVKVQALTEKKLIMLSVELEKILERE